MQTRVFDPFDSASIITQSMVDLMVAYSLRALYLIQVSDHCPYGGVQCQQILVTYVGWVFGCVLITVYIHTAWRK